MTLGVLTDRGIFMAQAPTITNVDSGIFSFRKKVKNKNIHELIKTVDRLRTLDE